MLFILDICTEYTPDLSLQTLTEYSQKHILRLIDEIIEDDANEYNIKVHAQYKFAKIISEYAEKQLALRTDGVMDAAKHVCIMQSA